MDRVTNPWLPAWLRVMSTADFVGGLLRALIMLAFIIGIVYFFVNFILGGIQWIGAGGDKNALQNAQSRIKNALLGIIVLFSLYAIINLIGAIFGINLTVFDLSKLMISDPGPNPPYDGPYDDYFP